MRKQVRICNCGRIHFIDESEIDNALKSDKDLMVICGGCGRASRIGADRQPDLFDPNKEMFNMYTFDAGEKDFTIDDKVFSGDEHHKGVYKVLYSVGKKVMMKTGMHAKSYNYYNGKFEDIWYPDFLWYVQSRGFEYFKQEMTKWDVDKNIVNMDELLRELSEKEAESLSNCIIRGLDWSNTKYAKNQKF